MRIKTYDVPHHGRVAVLHYDSIRDQWVCFPADTVMTRISAQVMYATATLVNELEL